MVYTANWVIKITSWCFFSTPLKHMLVKMGSSSPMFRCENSKKYLSCHHLDNQMGVFGVFANATSKMPKAFFDASRADKKPPWSLHNGSFYGPCFPRERMLHPTLQILWCLIVSLGIQMVEMSTSGLLTSACLMLVFWALGILYEKKAMSLGWLKTVLLSRWSMISLATNRWSRTYWCK